MSGLTAPPGQHLLSAELTSAAHHLPHNSCSILHFRAAPPQPCCPLKTSVSGRSAEQFSHMLTASASSAGHMIAVPLGTSKTALPQPGTCLRCLHLVREAASSSIDTLLDVGAPADRWLSAACALATLCSFAARVADSGELDEQVLDFCSLR